MATAVYSVRFIAVNSVGGEGTYTVPSGYRAIVRDIDTAQVGGEANTPWDCVNDSLGYVIAGGFYEGVESYEQWRGRQVVNEGETIETSSGGSGLCSFAVSGYLLTLP